MIYPISAVTHRDSRMNPQVSQGAIDLASNGMIRKRRLATRRVYNGQLYHIARRDQINQFKDALEALGAERVIFTWWNNLQYSGVVLTWRVVERSGEVEKLEVNMANIYRIVN